ncbi:MAG TPA: hypothetical protein VEK07_24050 [Polyangiaceae bacterium]|nr:hypothetical protein [Polyangiaceae bacterium]
MDRHGGFCRRSSRPKWVIGLALDYIGEAALQDLEDLRQGLSFTLVRRATRLSSLAKLFHHG